MSLFLGSFRAVTLRTDEGGRPVLVKRAETGPAAARLRREAAALELAAGAGAVELVELADEPDGGLRLVTAWVGGGSLATARLDPERLVRVARALATDLATLHARGLVHGRVAPDHVLLDGDRPALCGFSACRLPGEAEGPSTEDDVAALLALIEVILGDHRGDGADRLRAVVAAGAGGGAVAVADRLAAPPPGRRPPPPREPRRAPGPRPPRRPTERRPPVGALLAAGAGAVVLLVLAASVWRGNGTPPGDPPPSTTTAPTCPVPPAPAADLDGDGCQEPVRVRGAVVASGDRRWAVGDETDVAAVGDWDCDGRATAAVVRAATGQVWVYDAWATAGRTVTARPGPEAPGATAARAVAAPEGCDRLEVTTPGGGRRVLDLR
jgi:hypothetical protein